MTKRTDAGARSGERVNNTADRAVNQLDDTPIDRRGRLTEEVFTYRTDKDGNVFISWNGRPVTTLRDKLARQFLNKTQGADAHRAQLIMAKATGNFKRGSERGPKRR